MKVKLLDTLAGKEYESFLSDYGFDLVLDENGAYFSCTVVQNKDLLLAFTYQMSMGQNFSLAELGSPINADAIAERKNGWSLIGEVWGEAYDNYHKKRKLLPYPHELERGEEVLVVNEMLCTLISRIRSNEVSVGKPKYRMK